MGLGLFHGLAFVVLLLSLAESHQDFGPAPREIHLQGYQGKSFLAGLIGESSDFTAMQQQFSRAAWIVVEAVGFHVLLDVATEQPEFVAAQAAVGLGQRNGPGAQALHLAADEHDPALERLQHQVVMSRLAVLRDDPLVVVLAVGGCILALLLFL
jgi:hypothetical protein